MTKAVKKNHKKQVKKEDFSRPPIVVILGHVDSGKTSLLDYICKTHIAPKESGGITQRIDAYQIDRNGEKMTFIDTPGHEAFSIMRSRGAKVADIAVLVVDATQGVQDQTKESIFQIKSSGIPFIVALNKIDMKNANPEKCKRELIKEDVLVESMGGQVPSVGTSARDGKGVDELLDLILLIAEMEELKGDLLCPAGGVIIESYMDSQRGPVASLILTEGILKPGSIVATSSSFGKIKKLEDVALHSIQKVGIIRFNPFEGAGGNQSFSLAILDQKDDGLVISSYHSKESTRIYAKPIRQGESKYPLTKEEEKAIKKAISH